MVDPAGHSGTPLRDCLVFIVDPVCCYFFYYVRALRFAAAEDFYNRILSFKGVLRTTDRGWKRAACLVGRIRQLTFGASTQHSDRYRSAETGFGLLMFSDTCGTSECLLRPP